MVSGPRHPGSNPAVCITETVIHRIFNYPENPERLFIETHFVSGTYDEAGGAGSAYSGTSVGVYGADRHVVTGEIIGNAHKYPHLMNSFKSFLESRPRTRKRFGEVPPYTSFSLVEE